MPTHKPHPDKVFTHLTSGQLEPLEQHDGPPGDGCCPSDTWAEGEIVLDQHWILLPSHLGPGIYRLLVGMYGEAGGQRLFVLDDQGHELAQDYAGAKLVVQPALPLTSGRDRPETGNHVYLPLREVDR